MSSARSRGRKLVVGMVTGWLAGMVAAAAPPCDGERNDALRESCEKRELARLDADLNVAYAAALAASKTPERLRQEQRAWVWARNSGGIGADFAALQRLHVERIAVLKLRAADPRVDLRDAVMGRYGAMESICVIVPGSRDGHECEGEAPSSVTLLPVDARRSRLVVDTLFFNGHSCSFDAVGTWEGPVLKFSEEGVVDGDTKPGVCRLEVRISGGKLTSRDVEGGCRMYCGARGSLENGQGEPRWPVSASELRPAKKR